MTEPVVITDRDQVRWIQLQRPQSRNALTVETNRALIAALEGAVPAGARVVVLTGAHGHFCSGLDLKDAMRTGPRSPADLESDMRAYFHGLIRAVRAVDAPVVAAVDGPAVGFGCDLALACDLRLVTERAQFGEIFVRRGLMPDGGGTFTLPRLIGLGRALELMFSGDIISGAEAVRIGMANRLLSLEGFDRAVRDYATKLAKGPPLVMSRIKRAVHESLAGDLDAALEREVAGQLALLASADFVEGVSAFLQKREPAFRGR